MDIFERASRLKLRFGVVGQISVEDLWDMHLTHAAKPNLDDLAKELDAQLKAMPRSFVKKTTPDEDYIQLRFDLVKHVIDSRLADAEKAKKRQEKHARNHRIMEIMAQKADDELRGKSMDELQKLLVEDEEAA